MKQLLKRKVAFFYVNLSGAGGERVIVDFANEFSGRGIDVDIVLMQRKGVFLDRIFKGVRIVDLNTPAFFKSVFSLALYLSRNKPDHIISISPHTHVVSFIAKYLALSRTKLVFRVGIPYSYLFKQYESFKDKSVLLIMKLLFPVAWHVIANSKGLADELVRFSSLPARKISVIHNPKNVEAIREKAKTSPEHPWCLEREGPLIVAIGRLRAQKDFGTLVDAYALVRKRVPSRLMIIGNGSERDALEEKTRELGLENEVEFLGFVDNAESFMKCADVLVSTSQWEGLSNVIIEALVVGTPVVASDCQFGSREILAPESDYTEKIKEGVEYAQAGVLVPVGSSVYTAEAILKLLKDEKLRKDYERKALKRGEDFDTDKISGQFIDLLYS